MSPKNSTKPDKAQDPVTAVMAFKAINPDGDRIFQVAPGVCVVDALEDGSCLLSEILMFTSEYNDADTGLKPGAIYLIQETLESAKAIVDSSVSGLMAARHAGGAQ